MTVSDVLSALSTHKTVGNRIQAQIPFGIDSEIISRDRNNRGTHESAIREYFFRSLTLSLLVWRETFLIFGLIDAPES